MSGGCDEGSFWPRFGVLEVNASEETTNTNDDIPNAQPEKTDSDDDHDGRVEKPSRNNKQNMKKSDFRGWKATPIEKEEQKEKVMKRPSMVNDEKKKRPSVNDEKKKRPAVKDEKKEKVTMKRPAAKEEKKEKVTMKRPAAKEEKKEVMKRPSTVEEEKKEVMKRPSTVKEEKKDDEKKAAVEKKDDEMGGEDGEQEVGTQDDEMSLGGTTLSLPGRGDDDEDPGYSHADFAEVDEDLRESSDGSKPEEPKEAEAPKLGCSKCRYPTRGCAKCRGR